MHLASSTKELAAIIRSGRGVGSITAGSCNICGRRSFFLSPDKSRRRESNHCIFCGSNSRNRHIAKEALSIFDAGSTSVRRSEGLKRLRILNTGWKDPMTHFLADSDSYFYSEYFPDVRPGTRIEKQGYCEDIQALSFQDGYFDLIISEDVLEHVRDYKKGLAEVHRVLKQGGYHIFTVPYRSGAPTLIRVDTSSDKDVQLMDPEYHGGGPSGKILAYRTFGTDFLDDLERAGFDTRVSYPRNEDARQGIADTYVFISRRT